MQAANTPTGDDGQQAIAFELAQLSEELFTRANGTTLTGEPLFAGLTSDPAFTRDALAMSPTPERLPAARCRLRPEPRSNADYRAIKYSSSTSMARPPAPFAVLGGLAACAGRRCSRSGGRRRARRSQGIDAALDTAGRAQTILGTRMAWVEQVQQQQETRSVALAERRSRVGDTDIAEAPSPGCSNRSPHSKRVRPPLRGSVSLSLFDAPALTGA